MLLEVVRVALILLLVILLLKYKICWHTILCRPILEYADTVWDQTSVEIFQCLEMPQYKAVRFIDKGQESVLEACAELDLQPHKQICRSLEMKTTERKVKLDTIISRM